MLSGRRILAITSAFQADEAGSIPAARSNPAQQGFKRWNLRGFGILHLIAAGYCLSELERKRQGH